MMDAQKCGAHKAVYNVLVWQTLAMVLGCVTTGAHIFRRWWCSSDTIVMSRRGAGGGRGRAQASVPVTPNTRYAQEVEREYNKRARIPKSFHKDYVDPYADPEYTFEYASAKTREKAAQKLSGMTFGAAREQVLTPEGHVVHQAARHIDPSSFNPELSAATAVIDGSAPATRGAHEVNLSRTTLAQRADERQRQSDLRHRILTQRVVRENALMEQRIQQQKEHEAERRTQNPQSLAAVLGPRALPRNGGSSSSTGDIDGGGGGGDHSPEDTLTVSPLVQSMLHPHVQIDADIAYATLQLVDYAHWIYCQWQCRMNQPECVRKRMTLCDAYVLVTSDGMFVSDIKVIDDQQQSGDGTPCIRTVLVHMVCKFNELSPDKQQEVDGKRIQLVQMDEPSLRGESDDYLTVDIIWHVEDEHQLSLLQPSQTLQPGRMAPGPFCNQGQLAQMKCFLYSFTMRMRSALVQV